MSAIATRLLDNYVAGQWTPATAATDVLDVTNPATGEVLARVPLSGAADLDAAVRAAHAALPAWRPRPRDRRRRVLHPQDCAWPGEGGPADART
jgi:malonate-semialdehyde dehydrogenase (acetylating)/methylmalonate-semialdehyde dehydrogenase